jgi:hypothetical protein
LGLQQELKTSELFHQTGIPLLVSSKILRSRQMGQIDLARLIKEKDGWCVEVGEVKSSQMGSENFERSQKKRLWGAIRFLCGLFGNRGKLTVLVG